MERIGEISYNSATMSGLRSSLDPVRASTGRLPRSATSRRAILFVGMRYSARPAISIANASECPVPNA